MAQISSRHITPTSQNKNKNKGDILVVLVQYCTYAEDLEGMLNVDKATAGCPFSSYFESACMPKPRRSRLKHILPEGNPNNHLTHAPEKCLLISLTPRCCS